MSTLEWFEHFKHKLQGLTESHTAGGSPLSLLAYALKENQLTAEEYFPWAMAHYKLPRLQARFFTETPPRKEMLAKWATHYSWTVECLPVAEWDGILVVACLQPPQDFPSSPTCVFVLAPQEALEQCWNTWHPQVAAKIPSSAPEKSAAVESEMPEGLAGLKAPAAKKSGDSFSFEDLGDVGSDESHNEEASSEEHSESAGEEMGGLEGLFDAPVVKLQSFGSDEAASTTPPASVPEETPVDQILNSKSASEEEAAKTFDRTVVDSRPSLSKVEPVLEKKSEPAPAVAASIPAAAPAASKAGGPPPPPKDDLPDLTEESFGNKPIAPIVTRPTGVAKPTMNPVASGSFSLEKLKKKNSGIIADKVKRVLSEMKAHFEKSMILTLDEQESQVTAFAWDENFQEIKDTSMRIPLESPSIFKIVASTQKPFHGYISLNDLNENFFEQWNQGAIPDHVTITPIVINEKLVGMLMGLAEKSAYNKASLGLAERLSTEFTKGLQAA
ncbi:hypothetical protein DOM22_10665 [Bdellovibrio sp. ZAP7]|uniref:hypothetical protein n=1 Tax=Bdellovibrio sp. ZAP7 TaxID=2231053 RepID=UPI0011599515|nr:hypothetical protein [Bdellovibrio sp. ZAP7]QDK45577.1 hypothetical protein DOM22_10665 [Bdellovibrio sp. ZAP7]